MKLSVIIPVYNEEGTLAEIIHRVRATGLAYEIIVVDDGSTDKSPQILAELQSDGTPPLTILSHERNQGKGAAVRTGLAAATGDLVLVQDADLEYDPANYPALLSPFADTVVEAVYGSRNLRRNPRSSFAFYWGGRLLSWVANWLYGAHITDEATGYKLFRTRLLREIELEGNGFEFCPEVTAKLLQRGTAIHEVPISYTPRSWEEGKKIQWYDGLTAIWALIKYRFFYPEKKESLRAGATPPQIGKPNRVILSEQSERRISFRNSGTGCFAEFILSVSEGLSMTGRILTHLSRIWLRKMSSSRLICSQWAMIGIILLATLLCLPSLGTQSIAFDESYSLVVGQADWVTLFEAILSDGVHPPLFYILHKGALALWGTSEFGQRFSAAIFSILSVALGYKVGQVILNRRVGLLAALLLALNPLHVWLAQEARMYSLFGALTIVSMMVFWQAVHTNRRRDWIALAVVNSIIFVLHYFGFLVPTVQFIFIVLTFRRNHRRLRPWATTQVMAVVPLLPWLIATATRKVQTFGIGFLVRPTVLDLPVTFWNFAVGSSDLLWPASVLAIVVSGVALINALRPITPHKEAQLLVGLWGLLPPLLTWLVSQRRSFYSDRYLSFVIPGLILLFAFGATRVTRSPWRGLLIGGLVAVSGYGLVATHLDPAFKKDDWRGAASYVAQNEQPGDVILLYTTHIKFAFSYYYQGNVPQKPISLNLDNFPIEPLTEGHRRAWVVYPYTRRPTHYPMQPLMPDGYWNDDPARHPLLVKWLQARANNVLDYRHFRGIEIWLIDLTAGR